MSSDGTALEASNDNGENKVVKCVVVLPQCVGAGGHTFELNISLYETIGDLRQYLTALPLTKSLTSYNITLHDTTLNTEFDELASWEEIFTSLGIDDSNEIELTLRERPYNLAGIYTQINRFREMIGLNYLDCISQSFGVQEGVENFNSLKISPVKPSKEPSDNENEKEGDISSQAKEEISQIAKNMSKLEVSVSGQMTQDSQYDNMKIPIKYLSVSQWSPVPSYRFQAGDLLYLTLQTLESDTFHITCHATGFFVNRSSAINFNPDTYVNEKGVSRKRFLLFDLVESLSSSFGKTIEENDMKVMGSTSHPELYLLPTNSSLSYPWIVDSSKFKNLPDLSRSQLPLLLNGTDGSDLIRDWNEDIQSLRELPGSTISEKIMKEKLLNKALSEFNKVATKTAVEIVRGNIAPMNPNESEDQHIYLKNNIFYSTSSNNTGVFEKTGGSEAARYTSNKDLAAIKILNRFDVNNIHVLVTCLVDYMGRRIICQAPVPGIFNDNIDGTDKVAYGLSTEGSDVFSSESFNDGLKEIADIFHLKPHKVVLSDSVKSEKELLVSKDSKGIVGTDGRKYVVDLYRTTPLDVEFIKEISKKNDVNNSYPHKEVLVRHEAVEEWWKRKAAVILKIETERLEKEGSLKAGDGKKPQIALQYDRISLNPDSFTTLKESESDQQDVREVSSFIKENLIQEFLDNVTSQIAPFDGQHLTSILHKSGINMRYLGYIASECIKRKEDALKAIESQIEKSSEIDFENDGVEVSETPKEVETEKEGTDQKIQKNSKAKFEPILATYDSIYKIALQEMISRAVKSILRKSGEKIPLSLLSHFVVHFHNCLFGVDINSNPVVVIDESLRSFFTPEDLRFTSLNSKQVHELVSKEVQFRFRFKLPSQWFKNLVKPLQLLREIALKFGIQWKMLDYCFDADAFEAFKSSTSYEVEEPEYKVGKKTKKKSNNAITHRKIVRTNLFEVGDIISFVPLVKDSSYRSSLVDDIFETAKVNIQNGETELAISLLNELTSIYEQIYGILHPTTARYYTNLSQVFIDLGYTKEACTYARKAVILCERLTGLDSYETISAYINLAFFEVANEDYSNSFKLYQHALSKWRLAYGANHPSFVTTFANLADMLVNLKLGGEAYSMLKTALNLSLDVNGEYSELTALLYYRLGITSLSNDQFESSLEMFEKSNKIFVSILGKDDFFSTESSKYISSVSTYIQYVKNRPNQSGTKQKKSAHSQKAKPQPSRPNNSKGKRKQITQSDPKIATKSVDDILKFIEG